MVSLVPGVTGSGKNDMRDARGTHGGIQGAGSIVHEDDRRQW